MSQITIVDHVLDFTDISAPPAEDGPDMLERIEGDDGSVDEDLNEEQRIARELTSIRISGRLPE